MEFNVKLQELRKQKGWTQEEVAKALFVSRTAVSKWESGRGYPNIDSLKLIANLFSVTIDELLSGEELISLVEEDKQQNKRHIFDTVFGLLDFSIITFLFLPIFGQKTGDVIYGVSLLGLSQLSQYIKATYFTVVITSIILGVLNLTLPFNTNIKAFLSLILNAIGVLLFTFSRQPYAAALLFVFLLIKLIIMIKRK